MTDAPEVKGLGKLYRMQKELPAEKLVEQLQAMGDRGLQLLRLYAKVEAAKRWDNLEGFEAFFNVCYGLPLVPHTRQWVKAFYDNKADNKGTVIEAHRDSAKTTILKAFIAWRIGKGPTLSWLLIQAGDTIAQANASSIATLIEGNIGWKMIFPNVVPWKDKNWGDSKGYWVMDTNRKSQWSTIVGDRKDPTLVGLTWNSDIMVGRRPTGGLVFDDIHNEKNSASDILLEKVLVTVKETILPMITKDPSRVSETDDGRTWKLAIGTPWVEGDLLDYLKALSTYRTVRTPLFKHDDVEVLDEETKLCRIDGEERIEPDLLYFDPPRPPGARARWVVPNWPEKFDEEYIYEKYEEVGGEVGFARQYLLDLSKSQERVFRWTEYPAEKLQPARWPVYGGMDPAFIGEDAKKISDFRSQMAICFSMMTPEEVFVPFAGVVERCTVQQAARHLLDAKQTYPNLQGIWMETDGPGMVAVYDMLRNQYPELRGFLYKARTGGAKKLSRLQEANVPAWMANGRVKLSTDTEDRFMAELKKQLRAAPYWKRNDCADAMYYSLYGARHRMRMPMAEDDMPQPRSVRVQRRPKRGFGDIGAYRGT